MAFSELDRTWVRHYLGFSAIWLQAEPRLENAITACQSTADGGSRPDSSGENYIKAMVYGSAASTGTAGVTIGGTAQNVTFTTPAIRGLIQIESQIAQIDILLGTSAVDEVRVDGAREMIRLRVEGRRIVYALARMLGMRGPRVDVFSSGTTTEDSDPFWASDSPNWP